VGLEGPRPPICGGVRVAGVSPALFFGVAKVKIAGETSALRKLAAEYQPGVFSDSASPTPVENSYFSARIVWK
jgi:hypothetical protein